MNHSATAAPDGAALEASLLGVLLSAETARQGATALLQVLGPTFEEMPAALAVRDRDGLTLHVLAESGDAHTWPAKLEPQFALGAQHGVDPGTGTMVVPLRANGRVVGALVLGDARRAASLLADEGTRTVMDTVAAVMNMLVTRTDAALTRRCLALRSVDAVIEGMAHQMANPLTGASAIAQLLAEELQDEGQRAAVGQVRQELTRAFGVLHDILDFQRDTRAHDGILDLNAVAERTLRFRGYAIREQGITLEFEASAGFLPVRSDSRGLEHALLVALRFAELRSHGTVNRRIAVRLVERPSAELAIEITDSGVGTIPDLSPGYFDLSFLAEPVARDAVAERPDLGFVDSILRGGGGRLEARGSKTDGTTLSLVLPRAYTADTASRDASK